MDKAQPNIERVEQLKREQPAVPVETIPSLLRFEIGTTVQMPVLYQSEVQERPLPTFRISEWQ